MIFFQFLIYFYLFFTVVHRYARHCYTSGKDGLWRVSSTVNINTICCFMYFSYLSLNQEFSAAFWRRTGLGLRMCVLFERGRNRDFQGLSLILLICIKVQFGNDDTGMLNVSLILSCFFSCPSVGEIGMMPWGLVLETLYARSCIIWMFFWWVWLKLLGFLQILC